MRVKDYLMRFKGLKDNDDRLISTVLFYDIKKLGYDPNNITGYKVLDLMAKGKLTNPESIRRCRAKLQEEYPELRGVNYNLRKSNSDNIKKELGYD